MSDAPLGTWGHSGDSEITLALKTLKSSIFRREVKVRLDSKVNIGNGSKIHTIK